MTLRSYLNRLDREGRLLRVREPISKTHQIAGVLKKVEPRPALFEQVAETPFRVAGNIFCGKSAFADYFQIHPGQIIPMLNAAIENRRPPERVGHAACQEVVNLQPDLDLLPLLRHCEQDGGNYISSGVVITRHPQWGQNADFHRCMQFSKTEMAVRVVASRHFDAFLKDCRRLEVAICIGLPPGVLAAAATSVEMGVDELEIANALEPLQVVKAKTVDLWVPAESEFVLEGIIDLDRLHSEGPFVDLTETYDVIRQQPVFELRAVTHRQDAIWHALLPGALEHKLLMGMPREPTIFKKVNEAVRCLDVNVNPGGCSWLHAIVKIDKQHEDDGRRAIEAAFAGHRSCKHVYVVDEDIDIYNPLEVEWAMATRFQGDRDLVIKDREAGSSLDPSSEPGSHLTTRVGFDLTRPLETRGKSYCKAAFPEIDLSEFIPSSAGKPE
jgi:2,5-furandicarboxylate decarboxylase 1